MKYVFSLKAYFKGMVHLNYLYSFIIKNRFRTLRLSRKYIFPIKIFFDLWHAASLIFYAFLFIFQIKPRSQVNCICDVNVDREKNNVLTFFP